MAEEENESLVDPAETTILRPTGKKEKDAGGFKKEVKVMLRGCGESENPHDETVALVEDLMIKYVLVMTQKAMNVGKPGIHLEDFIYLLQKDPKKYAKVNDLISMNRQLVHARRQAEPQPNDLEELGEERESTKHFKSKNKEYHAMPQFGGKRH